MSDLQTGLQHLAERGEAIGSERLRERVALDLAGAPSGSTASMIPRWAMAVAAAVATVVLVGGPLVLFGGADGSDVSPPPAQSSVPPPTTWPPTTLPPTTTTVVEVTSTVAEVLPPLGVWSPILATTVAKVAPPAATCPPGTTPDLPGAPDQPRPGEGPWNNQAAVFDSHAGRIVFVDDTAETWTFDVCTNSWERMEPEGSPLGGELVYDVDSDRTIAFGLNDVSVYDANTNSWSRRPLPSELADTSGWPGALYDPVSGLVLVLRTDGRLTSYDVDTDTWQDVGAIVEVREITSEGQTQQVGPPFLIGYVTETDRLVLLPFGGAPFQDQGGVMDPRTGETVPLEEPDGGVSGGFGRFAYAAGGETAYTFGDGVCRLDPTTLDWDCNVASRQAEGLSAMVYDTINDRLVVINNFCCNWPGTTVTDGVYAVDFNTGERIELLATANTRVEEDGS